MSFRLSSGTIDSMAGVFAPPKKYRLGSGGGKGSKAKAGGTILALAVSSMFPKASNATGSAGRSSHAKHAFGGSSHSAVSGRAIGAMERTARRTPEVMVRITGRQHGGGHVLANFSYISRLGHGDEEQIPLHTSDGDILRDGRDMQILAQDWQEWEVGGDDRRKGATSISMILSMPAGSDPVRLKDAALDFAREEFSNRSWVAALHVDRDHPHVHVTFARRDHDGRRFHPNRDDLFRYRQRFAEKLRDRGIEANATPARARGIDPTHEPIAARKVREKGEVPRIDVSRAERAQRFRERGIPDPVNAVLANQRATVLSAYERSITELSSSPSFADQMIAKSLEKFIASMPAPEPNSIKAMRVERVDDPPAAHKDVAADTLDPVAASLARAQAMRDRVLQDRDERDRRPTVMDRVVPAPNGEPTPDLTGRPRTILDRAEDDSHEDATRSIDEALRRVVDHDREQRDRDRTKDRDGPDR